MIVDHDPYSVSKSSERYEVRNAIHLTLMNGDVIEIFDRSGTIDVRPVPDDGPTRDLVIKPVVSNKINISLEKP